MSSRPTSVRGARVAAAIVAVVATLVTAVVGLGATSWLGKSFPGFLVLSNGVVASVGLPDWPAARRGGVYQTSVVEVDGAPVATGAEVYTEIAQRSPDDVVAYDLRRGLTTERVALPVREFGWADYGLVFGSYLATGWLYLLLAFVGTAWSRDREVGRALLLVGGIGGVFALSAVDIYGAGATFRIHALAETFFPAALAYLAMVLPPGARGRFPGPVRALPWCLSAALAIPYQLTLGQAGAYSVMHAAAETYLGVAGFGMILYWSYGSEHEERQQPLLRSAFFAATLGLAVPAVIMTASGVGGGALPVNLCAATAFLFPICMAYGVLRESRLPAVAGLGESAMSAPSY